jgi:iron(III) transport system permease protein
MAFKGEYTRGDLRFGIIRKLGYYLDTWRLITFVVALGVALPLFVIIFSFLHPTPDIWQHLAQNLLADLVWNTAVLTTGVLTATLILGVSLAWLTAVCDFPGRKIFSWALLLPLAMPTYVLAFVTLGLLDFSGPVQILLRSWFPTGKIWFPQVRSTTGIIMVMSLALYPYVYLLARSAFKTQGKHTLWATTVFPLFLK